MESLGFEFIGSERANLDQHHILRIYIDKPGGVNHEDCQKVSSQLDAVLDVEANIEEAYLLEVSSPGLDRKIFTPEQLEKQVGKQVKFKLYQAIDGKKRFSGELSSVDASAGTCTLLVDTTEVVFNLDAIEEARLVPDINF